MVEHGPRGGDELNVTSTNGWPTITYGLEYGGGHVGAGITQKQGIRDVRVSPSGSLCVLTMAP